MSQKKHKLKRLLLNDAAGNNTGESGWWFDGLWGIKNILKENKIFLILLLLATIGIYLNSLRGDFVSDDYATISQNEMIKKAGDGFAGLNLVKISNYLLAVGLGVEPLWYHLFSLVWYLVLIVLILIFLRTFFSKDVARIGTVLFAVHPIHVEAVSWISGKPYLFTSFFIISATLFFVYAWKFHHWKYIAFGSLMFLGAFLTDKPRAFALWPVLLLVALIKKDLKIDKKVVGLLAGLTIASVIMLAVMWPRIIDRINSVNSGYNTSESIFYNPFFQYPTAITKYLQLLFLPIDLTLYHTMYTFPVWLNWMVMLCYLGAIIFFFVKDKRYFFALSFIFASIIPSISPVKVSWLVAERYMFIGSAGFCLLLALLINDLLTKKEVRLIVVAIISMVYGVRTVYRNIDWQTNHKLWVKTVQVSPNSHNAWNNIGDDYDKLKQYDNAIKGFTQSTVVKPNYADAFHNRANIFYKIGRLDLARDSYETALSFSPALFQTYISLIQIDMMEKKPVLALEHANKLVSLQPNNPQYRYILGVVLAQLGDVQGASRVMKEVLVSYPNYSPAKEALIKLGNGSS